MRTHDDEFSRQVELIVDGLGPPGRGRFLEIGPGIGITLFELQARGYDIEALDTVPANVDLISKIAATWAPGLRCRLGDVARLDDSPGSYAGIYGIHVWEHVHDQEAALRACARALAPGGRLVIIDGNLLFAVHWRDFFWERAIRRRDPLAGFRWLMHKSEVREDFGMGWRGKDEDIKTVWWWRRALAAIPELRIVEATTTIDHRRQKQGRIGPGPLAPFAGRIYVVAERVAGV